MAYSKILNDLRKRYPNGAPAGINLENLAQLKVQNTFETHLDIAKSMATEMRKDMAAYDKDTSKFTQSLGCWSGFHAMQMMRAIKRQKGSLDGAYVYLSGWMVAGLRNRFGHLPDQSMHEKTSVVDLIQEIYTSLRQADEVELNDLFSSLKLAESDKEMIKAGACCLQIENQVSDAKQCGHQDGKVTVPREDFIEKLRACRMAFEELGVNDGVIVARTDSLGAGLTQKIPVSKKVGDSAYEYTKWLETEEITDNNPLSEGDIALFINNKLQKPVRLPNGLYKFQPNTGEERVIEDCISSLNDGGADLLWIETATPNVAQIASMVSKIREKAPHAKLTYNNSPSFNWTLNLRKQVREEWVLSGVINGDEYPSDTKLMSAKYDEDKLGLEADLRLQNFQTDISREAGVFHNLITLPTFHGTAKVMNDLSEGYFGDQKMLAYVKNIQREEIRTNVSAVKHQHEVGSNLGDNFKEMTGGEKALKAGGKHNTMNQFENAA